MATKSKRKKFRPPLKHEGPASLASSQASSTATSAQFADTSQQELAGWSEPGSQSWLSQLTETVSAAKPKNSAGKDPVATSQLSNVAAPSSGPARESQLDDSLFKDTNFDQEMAHASLSSEEARTGGAGFAADIPRNSANNHSCTPTHTVLSYCSEAANAGATVKSLREREQRSKPDENCEFSFDFPAGESGGSIHDSAALSKRDLVERKFEDATSGDRPGSKFLVGLFSVDSAEDEMMSLLDEDDNHEPLVRQSPSRFHRKNRPTPRKYDYSSMLPKLGAQRAYSNKQKKNAKTKKVRLVVRENRASHISSGDGCASVKENDAVLASKADLSVYDYQPTPQQGEKNDRPMAGERDGTTELNNSIWISRRTREEQVSVYQYIIHNT